MREENEQLDIASTEYWAVVTGGVFDFLVNSWSVWHGKDSISYTVEPWRELDNTDAPRLTPNAHVVFLIGRGQFSLVF